MTDSLRYVSLHAERNVSIVTLNRPERLNAIGTMLLDDLHRALVAAQSDPDTRAIVFTGAGRAFCAGDDLKEFGEQTASHASVVDTCERIQQITRDLMFGPKLVVGAVHGYAVGGGFEWMLNCDMVVAADDLVAFFPEMALGHFVTGGVTALLPQAVGYQRAMEMIVLGERFDAPRLMRLGLVNRVAPVDAMLATATNLAAEIAQRSPAATSRLKRVMTQGVHAHIVTALEQERQAAVACFSHPDTERRVNAFAQTRL